MKSCHSIVQLQWLTQYTSTTYLSSGIAVTYFLAFASSSTEAIFGWVAKFIKAFFRTPWMEEVLLPFSYKTKSHQSLHIGVLQTNADRKKSTGHETSSLNLIFLSFVFWMKLIGVCFVVNAGKNFSLPKDEIWNYNAPEQPLELLLDVCNL